MGYRWGLSYTLFFIRYPSGVLNHLLMSIVANKNYEAMQRTIRTLDRVQTSLIQAES